MPSRVRLKRGDPETPRSSAAFSHRGGMRGQIGASYRRLWKEVIFLWLHRNTNA
jgi:hypothetical protein